MDFDYASLERRIASLESRSPASLRYGRVTGTEGGAARVQLDDADGVVTAPLSTIQKRVLKDQDIKLPDVGEPVAVLTSGQGDEHGIVIGSMYSGAVPDPGQERQMEYCRFEDGTTVTYDRTGHKMVADVQGDVDVTATGNVTVKAEGEIALESSARVRLKAPFIEIAGALVITDEDGGPCQGVLSGSLTVRNGGVSVPDSDVTAGGVSVRGHVHADSGGTGNSGTPVGG